MRGTSPVQVKLIGVRELVRAVGAISPALRKEIGQKNKEIGQRVIDKSFPKPESVGAGTGATPRPSASTTVLRIMAGGSWRKYHVQQWGKTYSPRHVARPYIVGAGQQDMPQIERDYLDALDSVCRKAGLTFRRI